MPAGIIFKLQKSHAKRFAQCNISSLGKSMSCEISKWNVKNNFQFLSLCPCFFHWISILDYYQVNLDEWKRVLCKRQEPDIYMWGSWSCVFTYLYYGQGIDYLQKGCGTIFTVKQHIVISNVKRICNHLK